MKNKRKILSLILIAVVCIFTLLVKTTAGVAEKGQLGKNNNVVGNGSRVEIITGNFENDGDIQVKKVVEQTSTLGRYKVHFEIRGKEIESEDPVEKDVYVVVVFDKSGSMKENTCTGWGNNRVCDDKWNDAVGGATTFSTTLLNKIPNAQIALVQFSGSKGDETCKRYTGSGFNRRCVEYIPNDAVRTRDFENSQLTDILFGDSSNAKGGTNLAEGLNMANDLFTNANIPEGAKKYVVVISDGSPTFYTMENGQTAGNGNTNNGRDTTSESHAFDKAQLLKSNEIEIFSIGYSIENDNAAQSVLRTVASADVAGSGIIHYRNANAAQVAAAFTNIAMELSKASAGKNAVITDNIGAQFTLVNGNGARQKVFNTIQTITENWQSTEDIYIDIDPTSETGWHETNDGYILNYIAPNGQPATISSNENPQAYWIKPISINVTKVWSDSNNIEKIRPNSVTVRLKANGVVVDSKELSESNNWTCTFANLDRDKIVTVDGEKQAEAINYEIVEDSIEGYIASYSTDANGNITITNTHSVETTTVKAKKIWVNAELFGVELPKVKLKFSYRMNANDSWKILDEVIIGEEDNWEKVWTSAGTLTILPNSFEYKVEEIGFDEESIDNAEEIFNNFFKKSISSNNNEFTITNTCIATYELPETGSAKMLILIISMIASFGAPIIISIYTFMRRYI